MQGIVNEFLKLSEYPRASHHEEKIGRYLCNVAKENKYACEMDTFGNVMFNIPGTSGMEKAPIVILQAHMDMVVAVKEGKKFDPINDHITVINDGKILKADGTSLGADDGIGVAIILYLFKNCKKHGPLRAIFTTDEEDHMSGALNMKKEWALDAKYVINLDSEESNTIINSSASANMFFFTRKLLADNPKKEIAINISMSGLPGGHSGMEIDKNKLNAIIEIAKYLENIDFELVSFDGGIANNVIPSSANATIVIDKKDYDKFDNEKLVVNEVPIPKKVLSLEDKNSIINFITNIINGVNSMSPYISGLVESSSNLGVVKCNLECGFNASICARSSSIEKDEEIKNSHFEVAKKYGISCKQIKAARPWPVKPDSNLIRIMKECYKKQNGKEMDVIAIHAGLETGAFLDLNANLDMVAIGPDCFKIHSIDEYCVISAIEKTYNLIISTLSRLTF